MAMQKAVDVLNGYRFGCRTEHLTFQPTVHTLMFYSIRIMLNLPLIHKQSYVFVAISILALCDCLPNPVMYLMLRSKKSVESLMIQPVIVSKNSFRLHKTIEV